MDPAVGAGGGQERVVTLGVPTFAFAAGSDCSTTCPSDSILFGDKRVRFGLCDWLMLTDFC